MVFKNIILFFLILTSTKSFTQSDVFEISRNGSLEQIEKLYYKSPEVINTKNERGHTPLILACYNGNVSVAKFLIARVNDVNETSDDGSALMAATVKGQTELVELLLEKNANPNLTDVNGTTALHYAVMFEQEQIIKSLIANDAKVNIKNGSNQTALDIAKIKNNQKIIEILKKAMT